LKEKDIIATTASRRAQRFCRVFSTPQSFSLAACPIPTYQQRPKYLTGLDATGPIIAIYDISGRCGSQQTQGPSKPINRYSLLYSHVMMHDSWCLVLLFMRVISLITAINLLSSSVCVIGHRSMENFCRGNSTRSLTFPDVIEYSNHSCCHGSAVPAGKISCGSAADSEDIEVDDSDVGVSNRWKTW